jgi:nitrite reductase/ring-hydroxylating ferredoxin subunit
MSLFKALLGICETKPLDSKAWSVDGGKVTVNLDDAAGLKNGAVYLEGQGLERPILIVNVSGDYHAFSNRCRHLGRKLDLVAGKNRLRCCSLMHSEYDLDGRVIKGPATESVKKYEVSQTEGNLIISLS